MEVRIKTALEKALERAASFGEVPSDEIERMEQMPRGRAIAAAFINKAGYDIKGALDDIPPKTRTYVIEGCQEVFLMNLALSADESANDQNRRAMEGIMAIKKDEKQSSEVLGEMDHLFNYYRQALEQTRDRFKQDFENHDQMNRGRPSRGREQEIMEFREEWSNVLRQLNARFETGLAELKERIKAID